MVYAVLVTHRTRPGTREQVRQAWASHMPAAVSENPQHLAYFYTFDAMDADVIRAFQVYPDAAAAEAFLEAEGYRNYIAAVEPLLDGPPEVAVSEVVWAKEPA